MSQEKYVKLKHVKELIGLNLRLRIKEGKHEII